MIPRSARPAVVALPVGPQLLAWGIGEISALGTVVVRAGGSRTNGGGTNAHAAAHVPVDVNVDIAATTAPDLGGAAATGATAAAPLGQGFSRDRHDDKDGNGRKGNDGST
jgi:hypothetical protein